MADEGIGEFLLVDSREVCCTVDALLDGDTPALLYTTALTSGEVLAFIMETLTRSDVVRPRIIDITGGKVTIGFAKLKDLPCQNVTQVGREYKQGADDNIIYEISYARETNTMGFEKVVTLVGMFAHARRDICSPALLKRWEDQA